MTPTSEERRAKATGLRELAHDNQGEPGPMRMRHVMEEGTCILGTVGLPPLLTFLSLPCCARDEHAGCVLRLLNPCPCCRQARWGFFLVYLRFGHETVGEDSAGICAR